MFVVENIRSGDRSRLRAQVVAVGNDLPDPVSGYASLAYDVNPLICQENLFFDG